MLAAHLFSFCSFLNTYNVKIKITLNDGEIIKMFMSDFPGGAVVKNPPANAGDTGSSPGRGRSHMPRSN